MTAYFNRFCEQYWQETWIPLAMIEKNKWYQEKKQKKLAIAQKKFLYDYTNMIQLFKLMKYEQGPPRTILIILKIF